MSDNRVQKLLFSKFSDFEDMVLIESPFAQTTRDGRGIRQVHLGLTPTKLVLATDVLPPVEYVNFKYCPGVDPLLETFELIAIYPVECVNLSIYRTKKNQALKARFCNNKVLYFELGGFENRAMFWNLWCEKVKFFCPNGSGSSRSETSVGTSTTGSTLYLIDKKFIAINGMRQLWCTFGPNPSLETSSLNETVNTQVKQKSKWTDRHLYLGKEFEHLKYEPVVEPPSMEQFLSTPKLSQIAIRNKREEVISYMEENNLSIGDSVQVNRFGSGINEGCNTGLFLTVDDYVVPRRYSHLLDDEEAGEKVKPTPSFSTFLNFEHLAETAVLAWEFYRATDPHKYKIRHKRRYGLVTQPMLFYGFGPCDAPNGIGYSLQMKRAVSEVCLHHSKESICRPSLSKNELTASISHQLLATITKNEFNNLLMADKQLTYFWTPGYKYKPKTGKQIYEERLKNLTAILEHHESISKKQKRKRKRAKFGRNFLCLHHHNNISNFGTDDDSNDDFFYMKRPKKQGFIYSFLPYRIDINNIAYNGSIERSFQYIKDILKLDRNMCAWDFDSTTLTQQLTMIEKELFLKIPPIELEFLLFQQSSRNARNIAAILAFSQRVSNLFAYEVLQNDCVKVRARLISRFINVAEKCHRISNFQSCRSVLSALQSPAIFRLSGTWAYLRKKHASKYQNFEFLCKFYRDPRMLRYQKTFFIVSHTPPFLPYFGDIISKLLGKVPDYPFLYKMSSTRSVSTVTRSSYQNVESQETNAISMFHRFLKVFTLSHTNEAREKAKRARNRNSNSRKKIRIKGLYEYYKPFNWHEDTRKENLDEAKAFLERCQLGAINYTYELNEMAKSYLLKARYQDDKENFIISLSVESPRNYYESNQNKL